MTGAAGRPLEYIGHVSRVPSRPIGRKIRISDHQEVGHDRRDLGDGHVPDVGEPGRGVARRERSEGAGQRAVHRHGKGLHQPDQQRGDKCPRERAETADDDDHEQDWSEQSGHVGLRHQSGPGDHAGDRGERGADAENHHEDAVDIVSEMARPCADASAPPARSGPTRVFFSAISSAEEDGDRTPAA